MSRGGAGAAVGGASEKKPYRLRVKVYSLHSVALMEVIAFFPFLTACLTVTDFPMLSITNVSVTVFPVLLGLHTAELFALLKSPWLL